MSEIANVSQDKETIMKVEKAHALLGHSNNVDTRKSAKALGWHLCQGDCEVCVACSEAKAKQKNLHTKTPAETEKLKEPNERVHLDLATIKAPTKVNVKISLPVWRIIVDGRTGFKTTHFFETKDGMVEPTCELFKK